MTKAKREWDNLSQARRNGELSSREIRWFEAADLAATVAAYEHGWSIWSDSWYAVAAAAYAESAAYCRTR